MTKAEEAAMKAYPYFPTEVNLFGHKTITADGNSHDRAIYRNGYEQAEKDLALTWEDCQEIYMIAAKILYDLNQGSIKNFPSSSQEIYEEVLQKFIEKKQ